MVAVDASQQARETEQLNRLRAELASLGGASAFEEGTRNPWAVSDEATGPDGEHQAQIVSLG